jgi:hypothetical protein
MPFRSDDELVNFLYVNLDGAVLAAEHYQVSSGSIRVILNTAYLDTLEAGIHTLGIVSTNGEASGIFIIPAKEAPSTPPAAGEVPKPTETEQPAETEQPDETTEAAQTGPVKAGDSSHLELWVTMLLLSACGVVGCTTYTRRKKAKKSK